MIITKKILVFMIALLAIGTVFAWGVGGNGVSTPWPVNSCSDLNDIGNDVSHKLNQSYKLTTNLTCGGGKYYINGTFTGILDGNGKYISNVNVTVPGNNAGLISIINASAVVKNLGVKDSYFSGYYAGGIASLQYGGLIDRCYVYNVTLGGGREGGIVFEVVSGGNITNCYVKNSKMTAGGLVGVTLGQDVVYNSYTRNNIIPVNNGGLIGDLRNVVNNSYGDLTNSRPQVYMINGAGVYTNVLGIPYNSSTFNISGRPISTLGWNASIWCVGNSNYPMLRGIDGQDDTCNAQMEEQIPETNNIATVLIFIAVVCVAAVLLFKQR